MKLLFSLFVAIGLSGCATPADRRNNPPDIVTSSKKSAKEVAICIAEKWENTKPFLTVTSPPVSNSIKMNGYTITANQGGVNTFVLADVTEAQLESTTKYYKMGGGGYGDYDQAVMECQ